MEDDMKQVRALMAALVVTLLVLARPVATSAQSGEVAVWQGERYGRAIWITLVPRGHSISANVRASEPWWRWGNTSTDAYLFAVDTPENVRVILTFHQQNNGLPEAQIYLNEGGRKPVDYTLDGGNLEIMSQRGYPDVIVRPQGAGWFIGDQPNYQLQILVDGNASPGGQVPVKVDGTFDWEARVGADGSNTPTWTTSVLLNDVRPSWGYTRFSGGMRMPDAPPYRVEPAFMPSFPHFTLGNGRYRTDRPEPRTGTYDWFKENPRPLYYNMHDEQFEQLSFVGFQNAGMYYYYSTAYAPYPNFESPFAFYSFVPESRYPQLVVRAARFPAGDRVYRDNYPDAPRNQERTSFRYSWTLDNSRNWRYSLDVAGSYPYTETMQIGDIQLYGVPSTELPTWVTSKEWPLVTFVSAEKGYVSSEGIYAYTAQAMENRPWLDGVDLQPPHHFAQPWLAPGLEQVRGTDVSLSHDFRGEYSTDYSRQPTMYLSPVDNRLHLAYAEGGVWNLGDGQVMRMHNLDADKYIDGWTRETLTNDPDEDGWRLAEPGVVEESLYALGSFMLYSGPSGVVLRQASYEPAVFELRPPTDRASWEAFRKQIAAWEEQRRASDDLRSWIDAFDGQALIMAGSQASSIRLTADGFRFVLDLPPNAATEANQLAIDIRDRAAGRYLVTYDGRFTITPLTPPKLSATIDADVRPAFSLNTIRLTLRNDGLEDLLPMTADVLATAPTGHTTAMMTETVTILSQSPTTLMLRWAPRSAGEWTLTPRLHYADGTIITLAPAQVTVLPAPEVTPAEVIERSASPMALELLGAVLLSVAGVGAFAMWLAWGKRPQGQVHK
jgi:hypothetical protein